MSKGFIDTPGRFLSICITTHFEREARWTACRVEMQLLNADKDHRLDQARSGCSVLLQRPDEHIMFGWAL